MVAYGFAIPGKIQCFVKWQ